MIKNLNLFFLILFLTACGNTQSESASTDCTNAFAVISVLDGALLNECGCDEAAGTSTQAGETFTCTIPANKSVLFDYSKAKDPHQIISVGSPSFTSSPISQSSQSHKILSHVDQFVSTGTYVFKDRFLETLQGQIVVR